jgi:hypothetical protein
VKRRQEKVMSDSAVKRRPFKTWSSLSKPQAFSNFDAFFRANKFDKKEKAAVLSKLNTHPVFAVSRSYKKKFLKRTNVAFDFGERWEADMGDIGENAAWNDKPATINKKNRLFLLAIDLFSKEIFSEALKSKSAKATVKAWKHILNNLKPPQKPPQTLGTDKGKEFLNQWFEAECAKRGIRLQASNKKGKNSVIERLMRSFKKVAVLYAETHRRTAWSEVVKRVTLFLNTRYHRTIGFAPSEVSAHFRQVQDSLWRQAHFLPLKQFLNLQKRADRGERIKEGGRQFWLGKKVLIPYVKSRMDKETKRNYKYKVFHITYIDTARKPFLYKVKDENGKPAKRLYYSKELKDASPSSSSSWTSAVPVAGVLPTLPRKHYKLRLKDHGPAFDKIVSNKPPPEIPRRSSQIPRSSSPIRNAREKPSHRRRGRPRRDD